MINFIKKITTISPRYGLDEMRGAQIIIDELENNSIKYLEEKFESSVPKFLKSELFADRAVIPCIGCSFKSGEVNSLEQIHFNDNTDEISVMSFYDNPSVSVSRLSLPTLKSAKKISGSVEVGIEKYFTENILVGNRLNPTNIIFAHFDSIIGPGAVDNAAAVAMLIDTIRSNPSLLNNNLFVFAGNEEISFDGDDYDSHGYRVFESLHQDILKSTSQLIVIDGIGVSHPSFTQNGMNQVFTLKNLTDYQSKFFWLQNDQSIVLQNYHSLSDTVDKINPIFLDEAKELLINKIS